MLNFSVKVAKSNFFDRAAVQSRADAATLKNLSRWGAYTRTNAQRLLRYRERPSEPGKPPSLHRTMARRRTNRRTGKVTVQGVSPLREFLFFAHDAGTKSVVAGPARLSGKLGDAPAALEHGGESEVRAGAGTRRVTIRPRPFMAPAEARTRSEIPGIWRDSIKA